MEYFINLLKKAVKSVIFATALILLIWGVLYHLTDWTTVVNYFWIGFCVMAVNTWIANFRNRKIDSLLRVQSSWIIMAGVVLVLFHLKFETAAVLAAAAIMASPLFGATIYEGIVGLTLLIVLANMMT